MPAGKWPATAELYHANHGAWVIGANHRYQVRADPHAVDELADDGRGPVQVIALRAGIG